MYVITLVTKEAFSVSFAIQNSSLHSLQLYIMMTLTQWSKTGGDLASYSSNDAAVWVKIVSSWLCAGLYVWTLVAPAVLTDRDFG